LSEDENDQWLGTTSDDTDIIVLHRFFDKHADKIGKELLSLSKPSTEGDATAISGKRAWDGLCALLVDLGSPMEVPRLSPLTCDDHIEYLDLMGRYARRDTEQVANMFMETDTPIVCCVPQLRYFRLNFFTGRAGYFCAEIVKNRCRSA
jgi:hypothetical protein